MDLIYLSVIEVKFFPKATINADVIHAFCVQSVTILNPASNNISIGVECANDFSGFCSDRGKGAVEAMPTVIDSEFRRRTT